MSNNFEVKLTADERDLLLEILDNASEYFESEFMSVEDDVDAIDELKDKKATCDLILNKVLKCGWK